MQEAIIWTIMVSLLTHICVIRHQWVKQSKAPCLWCVCPLFGNVFSNNRWFVSLAKQSEIFIHYSWICLCIIHTHNIYMSYIHKYRNISQIWCWIWVLDSLIDDRSDLFHIMAEMSSDVSIVGISKNIGLVLIKCDGETLFMLGMAKKSLIEKTVFLGQCTHFSLFLL